MIIDILQTILDVLWLIVKIGVLICFALFIYGLVLGIIDNIAEHKND
jgi:hypothetical protein